MPVDSIVQGVTSVSRSTGSAATATPRVPPPSGLQRQDLPATEQVSPAADGKAASASDLQSAVSHLNDYVQSLRRELQFSVDDASGQTVVKVVDPNSGELIRQIPSEEVLEISHRLQENVAGLLVNTKV